MTASNQVRGLIGVLHLPAMPGDPRHDGRTWDQLQAHVLADADAFARGGVECAIIENFGSTPFVKGSAGARLPPHQVAFMARLASQVIHKCGLRIGINCLRNDARSAIGIACASGADFVRVNVHTGAYVTDQGVIEGEAHDTLRYRHALGGNAVAIFADVLVKHATPLAPLDPAAAVADCFDRGLADAVVVTGDATGAAVSAQLLAEIRAAAETRPVFIGSGLSPDNADHLAPLADGAIVGTSCKRHGNVRAPVDTNRVRALVDRVCSRFIGSTPS